MSNANRSVPAANLWLCTSGPCSGPGEGHLKTLQRVFGVRTAEQDGDADALGDGVGAYEFAIDFDTQMIQSIDASDLVFSANTEKTFNGGPLPAGAGYRLGRRGPACVTSVMGEAQVRFACVTAGPGDGVSGGQDGPNGRFDLAMLDIVPAPLLTTAIYPRLNTGAMTALRNRQCEVADVYGYTANGGVAPSCGSLAVTLRALEGDLNLDCKVDVQDEAIISYRYGLFAPTRLYEARFDLEPALGDGDIDIKDLQKVFGREGSTCQRPLPPQPPLAP